MTNPYTLLKAWNLRARKQLGQNFLANQNTAEMIVTRARLNAKDVVVEIGSGLGALTIPLARRVEKVYAVEIDHRLTDLLKTELQVADLRNVQILEQDFMRLNLADLAREHHRQMVVCGNLPYHISSQILVRLIKAREVISRAILMFQKELAERLMAPTGVKAYGRISAMLQYCADIQPIAVLGKQHFHPSPKIASQVIAIEFHQDPVSPVKDERLLFRVIKAAFANRRKTLKNSLSAGGLGITAQMAQEALQMASIDPGRRAETLTPSEFAELTLTIEKFVTGNSNLS